MDVKIYNENNSMNVYLTPYCDMYIDKNGLLIINRFYNTSIRVKGNNLALQNIWTGLQYGVSKEAFDSLLTMLNGDSAELKKRLMEGCFIE